MEEVVPQMKVGLNPHVSLKQGYEGRDVQNCHALKLVNLGNLNKKLFIYCIHAALHYLCFVDCHSYRIHLGVVQFSNKIIYRLVLIDFSSRLFSFFSSLG
jgi:hypothetical protein